MNKDDIFALQWIEDNESLVLHISLAWDVTKSIDVRYYSVEHPKNVEEIAKGKMFNAYGNDIIKHIQNNTDIITKCTRCGIVLLHGHTSHLCDPERPMPFNFDNIRQEVVKACTCNKR